MYILRKFGTGITIHFQSHSHTPHSNQVKTEGAFILVHLIKKNTVCKAVPYEIGFIFRAAPALRDLL